MVVQLFRKIIKAKYTVKRGNGYKRRTKKQGKTNG